MELGHSTAEKVLEWDSRKEVGEFIPAVDHSKEFGHLGYFQNPIPAFPEAKESFRWGLV